MSNDYPVQIDPRSPARFDRAQLLLRVAIAITLGWLGLQGGWFACAAFAILPVFAAIAISSVGSERYLGEIGPRLWRVLAWFQRWSAYMWLLVDRFPLDDDAGVEIAIRFTGRPTVGGALLRFATSLPSALALMLLGCVGSLLWIIAALTVLAGATVPTAILGFQRGLLRWQARWLAYHASLVTEYPPWSLDTEPGRTGPSFAGHDGARLA